MDDEIDIELKNLIRGEREKTSYYLASLQPEREKIVADFHDHVIAALEVTQGSVFEAKLPEFDSDEEQELHAVIDELVQASLEDQPLLLTGEVSVSGFGVYAINDSDDGEVALEVLGGGDTIRGYVDAYCVAPWVSTDIDQESPEHNRETLPDLWVRLEDVSRYDSNGQRMAKFPEMLISFTSPNLSYHKVERREDVTIETLEDDITPHPNELFYNDIFRDLCNDIENDLNYNHDGEFSLHERCEQAQDQLRLFMMGQTLEGMKFIVNATQLDSPYADISSDGDLKLEYLEPVIYKKDEGWRVGHGFWTLGDGNEYNRAIVHILPENITSIYLSE